MKASQGGRKAGKVLRLALVMAGALILILMAAGPAASQTVSAYAIIDNYSGGDCTTIGAWDQYSKTCTLTADVVTSGITIGSDGLTLDGAGHSITGGGAYGIYLEHRNQTTLKNMDISGYSYGIFLAWTTTTLITGNTIDACGEENISLWASYYNTISDNVITNSPWDGIGLILYSDGNTVKNNTISGNQWGVWVNQAGSNSIINNNFINNATQAEMSGSGATIFSSPETGGNFYSDWTIPDANGDGFVDSPYILPGGQDDLPYTAQNGWKCTRPGLSLTNTGARWGSYADYLAHQLSIDFSIADIGVDAYGVTLVGSNSSNGVTAASDYPVLIGNVTSGGSVTVTLKYVVMPGVNFFRTVTYATASDLCGKTYSYPGPYPGV
ncbi:MAG: NosD domain-containing protein [Thermoleophilia bacterium]